MKEYQKIETLYKFNITTKGFESVFYNPIVKYLASLSWYATEKIDGTNIRIRWNGKTFEISGRTDKAQVPQEIMKIYTDLFDYNMEIIFEQMFGSKEVYLFMEGYGGKIQKGAYSCIESLVGYDIMINDYYLDKMDAKSIFEKLGLKFVPIFKVNDIYEAVHYVENNPNSILQPQDKMEGLVCTPIHRLYDHQGNRIIVKIKYRDLQITKR